MDVSELKKQFRKAFAVYSRISSATEISGFTPSFIVGERNYPEVPVFMLSSDRAVDANPENLFGRPLPELVEMRMSMVGGLKRERIFSRVREEIALSVKPAETETVLKARPVLRMKSGFHQPMFIQAKLKDLRVNDFKIPEKLERIVGDELKAVDMAERIYQRYGLYKVHDLMAGGFLGLKKRMVPTRWAITAVDDAIGKRLMEKVRKFRVIEKPEYYQISYLSNHFFLILLPSEWSFEMVEQWLDHEPIHDYEGYYGRKTYAKAVEGAYYAARLAVLEELARRKRQAKAIVLRKVDAGYSVPMGVWVIRESMRRIFSHRTWNLPQGMSDLIRHSVIYQRHMFQKKLTDF